MKFKEDCGCVHDGVRWVSLCPTDKQLTDELHRRAQEEHRQERLREEQKGLAIADLV